MESCLGSNPHSLPSNNRSISPSPGIHCEKPNNIFVSINLFLLARTTVSAEGRFETGFWCNFHAAQSLWRSRKIGVTLLLIIQVICSNRLGPSNKCQPPYSLCTLQCQLTRDFSTPTPLLSLRQWPTLRTTALTPMQFIRTEGKNKNYRRFEFTDTSIVLLMHSTFYDSQPSPQLRLQSYNEHSGTMYTRTTDLSDTLTPNADLEVWCSPRELNISQEI